MLHILTRSRKVISQFNIVIRFLHIFTRFHVTTRKHKVLVQKAQQLAWGQCDMHASVSVTSLGHLMAKSIFVSKTAKRQKFGAQPSPYL